MPPTGTGTFAAYLHHLEPGGTLALTMFVPGADDITGFEWRLRRTGTDQEGITYAIARRP